jgi:hypothetical protein
MSNNTIEILLNFGSITIRESLERTVFANIGLPVRGANERPSLLIWAKKATLNDG